MISKTSTGNRSEEACDINKALKYFNTKVPGAFDSMHQQYRKTLNVDHVNG